MLFVTRAHGFEQVLTCVGGHVFTCLSAWENKISIGHLVYGCSDEKGGAVDSIYKILSDERLNHKVEVVSGVLEEECRELVQHFFKKRRLEAKDKKANNGQG